MKRQVSRAGTSHGSAAKIDWWLPCDDEFERQNVRLPLSLHQGADHGAGVEAAQVVVGLPRAHEHDGLACDVSHGDGSADLSGREDDA